MSQRLLLELIVNDDGSFSMKMNSEFDGHCSVSVEGDSTSIKVFDNQDMSMVESEVDRVLGAELSPEDAANAHATASVISFFDGCRPTGPNIMELLGALATSDGQRVRLSRAGILQVYASSIAHTFDSWMAHVFTQFIVIASTASEWMEVETVEAESEDEEPRLKVLVKIPYMQFLNYFRNADVTDLEPINEAAEYLNSFEYIDDYLMENGYVTFSLPEEMEAVLQDSLDLAEYQRPS